MYFDCLTLPVVQVQLNGEWAHKDGIYRLELKGKRLVYTEQTAGESLRAELSLDPVSKLHFFNSFARRMNVFNFSWFFVIQSNDYVISKNCIQLRTFFHHRILCGVFFALQCAFCIL